MVFPVYKQFFWCKITMRPHFTFNWNDTGGIVSKNNDIAFHGSVFYFHFTPCFQLCTFSPPNMCYVLCKLPTNIVLQASIRFEIFYRNETSTAGAQCSLPDNTLALTKLKCLQLNNFFANTITYDSDFYAILFHFIFCSSTSAADCVNNFKLLSLSNITLGSLLWFDAQLLKWTN